MPEIDIVYFNRHYSQLIHLFNMSCIDDDISIEPTHLSCNFLAWPTFYTSRDYQSTYGLCTETKVDCYS